MDHHLLGRGAARGAAAFLTYGLIERVIVSIVPWLRESKQDFVPESWWFVFTLFVMYTVAGAFIGFCTAYLLENDAERAASANVKIFIVGLVIYDIIANVILLSPIHSSSYWAAIALQGSFVSLLITVDRRSNAALARAAGSALTISLLLLLPWQAVEAYADSSRGAKAAAAIAAVIVALAIGEAVSVVVPRTVLSVTAMLFVSATVVILLLSSPPLWKQAPPRSELPRREVIRASLPNIVILSLDTVRADHMAVYGYVRANTPNLQKFARGATLFTHAYSSGDNTLATHASIFTGEDVGVHGAHASARALGGRALPASLQSFAPILRRAGYTSLGVVANSGYLASRFGFDRGFSHWDSRPRLRYLLHRERIYHVELFTLGCLLRDLISTLFNATPHEALTRSASEMNAEVTSVLDRAQRLTPFLLFVNYMDTHFPYTPPAPFNAFYPGRAARFTFRSYERIVRRGAVLPAERAHLVSQYDGAIAYVDSEIGKLLAFLQQRELYDDALVIVVSDHGEALGERGQVSHGLSVDDDQIVVPLIIKFPRQRFGRVVDTPVSSVDLLPTILAAAGLRVPAVLRGRDLAGPIESRDVLAEHYGADGSIQRALISGPFKLVVDGSSTKLLTNGSLLIDEPAVSADLKARLDARISDNARRAAAVAADPERMNILRGLGYIR